MSSVTITPKIREVVNRHLGYEYIREEDVGKFIVEQRAGDMRIFIDISGDSHIWHPRFLDASDSYVEEDANRRDVKWYKAAEVILAIFGGYESHCNRRFATFFRDKESVILELREQMGLGKKTTSKEYDVCFQSGSKFF